MKPKITPCLWFDHQAEEAVRFYLGIFPNSGITAISLYGEAGKEQHGMEAGTVMTIAFTLGGQSFTALNGGPIFKFTEAVSLQIECETQEEIDHYWERLGAGGDPACQQCGWLKDRYGLSWQVVPKILQELIVSEDQAATERTMATLMEMKKLDIAALRRAFEGKD